MNPVRRPRDVIGARWYLSERTGLSPTSANEANELAVTRDVQDADPVLVSTGRELSHAITGSDA